MGRFDAAGERDPAGATLVAERPGLCRHRVQQHGTVADGGDGEPAGSNHQGRGTGQGQRLWSTCDCANVHPPSPAINASNAADRTLREMRTPFEKSETALGPRPPHDRRDRQGMKRSPPSSARSMGGELGTARSRLAPDSRWLTNAPVVRMAAPSRSCANAGTRSPG